MRVKIINSGEDLVEVYRDVTEEQYNFLADLFKDLNDCADAFAPSITIKPL